MKTYIFYKHLIDEEYIDKGYNSPKEYCLSLITDEYNKIRFCEVAVNYPLGGIIWTEGKTKMCNNKLYQVQILN